ncbi:MAG: ferrous iron transport protein B [Cyclobacteriaceae bacterium]
MEINSIALVGNPNSGKTSVFNNLTGLAQHVGNYPGVTVEKKSGFVTIQDKKISITDLPGTYSIYPRSEDEKIVFDLLNNTGHPDFPDAVVVVVDASNLERNLLLFTQIYDRKIPVILVLNMIDVADKSKLEIDVDKLSEMFGGVPIIKMNSRTGSGIDDLKEAIINYKKLAGHYPLMPVNSNGTALSVPESDVQIEETRSRYQKINQYLKFVIKKKQGDQKNLNSKIDRFVVHPVFGYLTFLGILFLMFQMVYSFAEVPMDLIDGVFFSLSQWTKSTLPAGVFSDLLAEGLIPGLGGVVIFIPQISLLFVFIVILEETGYMSRVVFIMDRLMRPFGLNGKSVVPLISGVACAIPAIMATRTIDHWKDRLVTILVTPLMSCSARLPVYTLLIALVIPDQTIGVFNLKGLTLLGLYLLGLVMALVVALVFKAILKTNQKSFLVMELPKYKLPHIKNVLLAVWEKVSVFIFEAGKIILAISIILWVLASYGPGDEQDEAAKSIPIPEEELGQTDYENQVNSVRLEHSYIGYLGKGIEPLISPLGYDWKIGIALITSFAAREVFVGSLATIYSVGDDFEEGESLINRMQNEKFFETGLPVYTLASGVSLMIFYVFAMQCMSTLAIVYRETKSWKWPLIQTIYMSILAYVGALISYNILS